jgi:hypothetical protein
MMEVLLEEGERIIGIKGRKRETTSACWHDVQFAIGKLE